MKYVLLAYSFSLFLFSCKLMKKKDEKESYGFSKVAEPILKYMDKEQKEDLVDQLTEEMHKAAKDLEFEKAANLRDEIHKLKKMIG